MYWNNSYYFDKVLPFGLRSAPYIFNQLSDALEPNQCPYRRLKTIDRRVRCPVYGDHTHYRCVIVEAIALA